MTGALSPQKFDALCVRGCAVGSSFFGGDGGGELRMHPGRDTREDISVCCWGDKIGWR